jgi:hypothetical protein
MKELRNLLKERQAIEAWLKQEADILSKASYISELKKQLRDLQVTGGDKATTTQFIQKESNNGSPINQTNTSEDMTDAAKAINEKISTAELQKAELLAKLGDSDVYKRQF